jgi:hypothetical protein
MRIPLAFALLAALAAPAALAEDGEERPKPAKAPEEGSVAGVRDLPALEEEVRSLRADINILNLVNGLHLTPHQIEHLARAAREAKSLIEEAAPPAPDPKVLAREARSLEAIRTAMLEGREAPGDALRDLGTARARRAGPRRGAAAVEKGLAALEDAVEAELLPSQREVVRTYKACLVPPKDLRDPVRVGQASDAGPTIRLLERVVAIPAERWEKEGPRLVERILAEEQEHKGRLGELEEVERRAALRAGFEEARALDAAEFGMRKEALAERLEAPDRVQDAVLELQALADAQGAPGKTARILLDPRAIPIYERRLATLRAAARDPVDLAAVKEADSCKDGRCAIRREAPER